MGQADVPPLRHTSTTNRQSGLASSILIQAKRWGERERQRSSLLANGRQTPRAHLCNEK